jgi:hypothetical protein
LLSTIATKKGRFSRPDDYTLIDADFADQGAFTHMVRGTEAQSLSDFIPFLFRQTRERQVIIDDYAFPSLT